MQMNEYSEIEVLIGITMTVCIVLLPLLPVLGTSSKKEEAIQKQATKEEVKQIEMLKKQILKLDLQNRLIKKELKELDGSKDIGDLKEEKQLIKKSLKLEREIEAIFDLISKIENG